MLLLLRRKLLRWREADEKRRLRWSSGGGGIFDVVRGHLNAKRRPSLGPELGLWWTAAPPGRPIPSRLTRVWRVCCHAESQTLPTEARHVACAVCGRRARFFACAVSRSTSTTVQPETPPFCWAKSAARTTSPTQHARPPDFCHRWSVRLEQSSGPCPQSKLHRSCFQAPAKEEKNKRILKCSESKTSVTDLCRLRINGKYE